MAAERTLIWPVFPGCRVIVRAAPPDHATSTVTSPRARRPVTEPDFHTAGSAGSTSMVSCWLWSSISAIPEVAPKFPSIWNGGWVSHRFCSVDVFSCSLSIL